MSVAKPNAEGGLVYWLENQREDTLSFPPFERSETLRFPPSGRRTDDGTMESTGEFSGPGQLDSSPASGRDLPERDPRKGDVIAESYLLEELIAAGSMGVVWRAYNQRDATTVAIKLVSPRLNLANEATERLRVEAQTLRRIDSPRVARIIDAGQAEGGLPYLVMELLRGETLQSILEKGTGVAIRDALDWVIQAAEGLADVHELGLVHDDLKPSNLFLVEAHGGAPSVKLLDFGVAHALNSPHGRRDAVLGNPWYLAPERLLANQPPDHRSDLWSLGVILYELVAGRRPFDGQSIDAVCTAVAAATPVPLRALRPEASIELERIVGRCLQPRPEDRYGDARRLIRELRVAQEALALGDLTPTVIDGSYEPTTLEPQVGSLPEQTSARATLWRPARSARSTAPIRRWPAMLAYSVAGTFVALIGVGVVIRERSGNEAASTTPNGMLRNEETKQTRGDGAPHAASQSHDSGAEPDVVLGKARSEASRGHEIRPETDIDVLRASAGIDAPASASATTRTDTAPISNATDTRQHSNGASASPISTPSQASARLNGPPDRRWGNARARFSPGRPESEIGIPVNQVHVNRRGELVDAQGMPFSHSDTGATATTSSNTPRDTLQAPNTD